MGLEDNIEALYLSGMARNKGIESEEYRQQLTEGARYRRLRNHAIVYSTVYLAELPSEAPMTVDQYLDAAVQICEKRPFPVQENFRSSQEAYRGEILGFLQVGIQDGYVSVRERKLHLTPRGETFYVTLAALFENIEPARKDEGREAD